MRSLEMGNQSDEVLPSFKQNELQRVLRIPEEPIEDIARLFLRSGLSATRCLDVCGPFAFDNLSPNQQAKWNRLIWQLPTNLCQQRIHVLPSAKENRIASSGVQEFRSSGVQGFRGSGVQGFRGSGWREKEHCKKKSLL